MLISLLSGADSNRLTFTSSIFKLNRIDSKGGKSNKNLVTPPKNKYYSPTQEHRPSRPTSKFKTCISIWIRREKPKSESARKRKSKRHRKNQQSTSPSTSSSKFSKRIMNCLLKKICLFSRIRIS